MPEAASTIPRAATNVQLGPRKLVPVRGTLRTWRLEPHVHLVEVGRLLLHARPVAGRELRHRIVQSFALESCTGRNSAALGTSIGPRRTVEEVPRPKEPLLTLDEQLALPLKHEERLLLILGVVEPVRLAWLQDADLDAEL